MKRSVLLSLVAALVLSTAAAPAFAEAVKQPQKTPSAQQDVTPVSDATGAPAPAATLDKSFDKKVDDGKFYFGVQGGVVMPQSQHVTFTGGSQTPSSGRVNFQKVGESIGLKAGYHFDQYVATEVELDYMYLKAGNVTYTNGGTTFRKDLRQNMHNFMGFANVVVTPVGEKLTVQSVKIVPYVTGGVGALSESGIKILGGQLDVSKGRGLSPALNGGAGVDLRMGPASVGVNYRYVWAYSVNKQFGPFNKSKGDVKLGNFGAHVVNAEAAVSF